MMKLAIETLPGTEVDSAYSASLGYEKEIVAARDQNARHWQVEAHIERGADGGATSQVEARDDSGQPLSGLTFQGRLERPTDKRADLRGRARRGRHRDLSRHGAQRRAGTMGPGASKAMPAANECSCRRIACC